MGKAKRIANQTHIYEVILGHLHKTKVPWITFTTVNINFIEFISPHLPCHTKGKNMNRGRSLELVFATPTTPATVHVYKKVLRFKFSFEVCVHEMSLIEHLSQYSTVKSIDCRKEDIKNAETVKKKVEIQLRLLNSFLRRPSRNTLRPLLF